MIMSSEFQVVSLKSSHIFSFYGLCFPKGLHHYRVKNSKEAILNISD